MQASGFILDAFSILLALWLNDINKEKSFRMTCETIDDRQEDSEESKARSSEDYDPFARGAFPVGVRTLHADDTARNRLFPCEVWYPAASQHEGQDVDESTQDNFAVPL